MKFDEVYKNKIGSQLTKRLAQALDEGDVTVEEARKVASYILANIDNATNHPQLINFLTQLSKKWSFYSGILTIEKGKKLDEEEEEKIEEVTELIKKDKVEEAIKEAESPVKKKKEKAK